MSYGKVVAIIPAAGQGLRMGSKKQFLKLAGVPIFVHTLRKIAACDEISEIFMAAPREDVRAIEETLRAEKLDKVVNVVTGGDHRQDSVRNCLDVIFPDTELVLVHDAVRPFVSIAQISAAIQEASRSGAAILGILSVDTIKQVERARGGIQIVGTLPRDRIVMAQTPQVFRCTVLQQAFAKAREENFVGTDEASLVEHLGAEVSVVPGSPSNIKITTPADLELARFYMQQELSPPAIAGASRVSRQTGAQ